MKTILICIILIIGMLISEKISRYFIKLMKNKLTPEAFQKNRFWIGEGAIFLMLVVINGFFVICGVINGRENETLYATLKWSPIIFAFFTIWFLYRLFIDKKKSPIAKMYKKYHPFKSSEAIHALEMNDKEILTQKIQTYPEDAREYLLSIMPKKMKNKYQSISPREEIQTECENLISKLEIGQPFTKDEIDTINSVLRINKNSKIKTT